MGCIASSQANANPSIKAWELRPERIPAERLQGSFMHQLVKEVFDQHPREVYDFCGPVLGKGGFATVLLVKHKTTGYVYAMKDIHMPKIAGSDHSMHLLQNEIESMKRLSHPNIVRLQEVYQPPDGKNVYLGTYYCTVLICSSNAA
jgi:Protein kinase domain